MTGPWVGPSSQTPHCHSMPAIKMTTGPWDADPKAKRKSIENTSTFLFSPALFVILMEV